MTTVKSPQKRRISPDLLRSSMGWSKGFRTWKWKIVGDEERMPIDFEHALLVHWSFPKNPDFDRLLENNILCFGLGEMKIFFNNTNITYGLDSIPSLGWALLYFLAIHGTQQFIISERWSFFVNYIEPPKIDHILRFTLILIMITDWVVLIICFYYSPFLHHSYLIKLLLFTIISYLLLLILINITIGYCTPFFPLVLFVQISF